MSAGVLVISVCILGIFKIKMVGIVCPCFLFSWLIIYSQKL